ncbi:MAG: hypothetical protein WCC36_15435, partial [Gammaproteobacteria bacterium]
GLGIAQGLAAPNKNLKKPILTKSGKKAALKQAAQAILQAPAVPMAPASLVDETKVPHYFGPFPNWALSSLTLPDVAVQITGDGTGATATATVGANGAVTGITITNPGSGYTAATVSISPVTGTGSGATADAVVTTSGVVTTVTVNPGGSGYTAPVVTFSGGGATTAATATAYGGVDAVTLTNAGSGYTNPSVEFDLPDNPDGVQPTAHALCDGQLVCPDGGQGVITDIIVDSPGSGYSFAPHLVIRNGTVANPVNGGSGATATATLTVQNVVLNTYGAGYTSAPTVTISDSIGGTGSGAMATATFETSGAVTGITNLVGGSGYLTAGGIKKFQDGLPMLCDPSVTDCSTIANNLGQYIPLAVPDTTTFTTANGFSEDADYYVIALVQHREQMNSSLPPVVVDPNNGLKTGGTLQREYVQLSTTAFPGKGVPLKNDLLDGTSVPALMPDGSQAYAVDDPHYMGPIIQATKDKPVRIVFYNLLPTGQAGDLFIPVDTTFMGSGMGPMDMTAPTDMGTVLDMVRNPMCGETSKDRSMCFADTRASIHLHGGITPWISDGSPHQWITPANEQTGWPEGVAVRQVPDMVGGTQPAGVPDCSNPSDGCTTFYYTNQQSARLMFYHDHAWGITRLNVYAGEAAGYLIRDNTEQKLIDAGLIPSGADEIPLVIQDRTFVPNAAQMAEQDPTWDYNRWGGEGNLWYEHVYMPAQNPNDPSGLSSVGRWFYGPWFWPPATPTYNAIA